MREHLGKYWRTNPLFSLVPRSQACRVGEEHALRPLLGDVLVVGQLAA
jgi:hypothetical protein